MREGMLFTIEPMINLGRPMEVLSRAGQRSATARCQRSTSTRSASCAGCEIFTLSPRLDRPVCS